MDAAATVNGRIIGAVSGHSNYGWMQGQLLTIANSAVSQFKLVATTSSGLSSPFGAGRLDSGWLRETVGDEWRLETTDPRAEGHRDAFIGNGFIGQRIGIEGDASAYPVEGQPSTPSGCLVHGLWDEKDLMAPPKWALLHYFDGTAFFARDVGLWRDYKQSLDLQTGILSTEVLWVNGSRTTRVISLAYIDRCNPGRCVLSRTLIPQFSGEVSLTDELDGTFIDDASDWRYVKDMGPQGVLSIELNMGPRQRRVALVSRLSFGEGFAVANEVHGLLQPDPLVRIEVNGAEKKLARTVSFAVEAGHSYTLTKVVALVTDSLAPAPWVTAWNLAEMGARDPVRMEQAHIAAWQKLWEHRIEVPHPRLQLLLNSALYQFYANLRDGGKWSLGPTGICANAWGGHAFWDGDLWMFPALCLLNPGLAKGFIEYRAQTLTGAQRNAQADGRDGACMAWESAEFGDCVIPHLIFHHQHHVNSDVALAQWWFWKISGDDTWFREKGAHLIIESAKFWASRVTYRAERDRYEIRQVCCADEFAGVQDNNAYTNYSAVKTLELAMAASDFLGQEFPPQWREMAAKMWIPYDDANQNIFEYEGYAGQTIKQADTALLVYPYEMPMSDGMKSNIVDYYRTKYPEGYIMMASAFDGIVDCELDRPELGWESLLKLLPHFREPFLLASESPANECISFMTGLGGFLQLILMGFAGIRIRDDGLQVQPRLPRAFDRMVIHALHYNGIRFDLQISGGKVQVLRPSGSISFGIYDDKGASWL